MTDGERLSGDFSSDPTFDPAELFAVIQRDENVARVSGAMRTFVERGDTDSFQRAVAVFVRSARAREEPIERVLGVLEELVDGLEGHPLPGSSERETKMRTLVLRGVLLAFYGGEAVEREDSKRQSRRI
jgi:hypothetical protein